jgi:hypothetical protein
VLARVNPAKTGRVIAVPLAACRASRESFRRSSQCSAPDLTVLVAGAKNYADNDGGQCEALA